MEKLTSLKNPKVQEWRSLKEKKAREEQKAFLVEGVRMVREALSSSFKVKALILREDYRFGRLDPGHQKRFPFKIKSVPHHFPPN